MATDCDVLVVGGGPVGAAAALALAQAGLAVTLVEARPREAVRSDARPIALSHGSRLILERLDLWQPLQPATPIERIHVSQQGGFGRVELDARDARLPALGYVLDYGRIAEALDDALASRGGCRRVRAAVSALQTTSDGVTVRLATDGGPRQASARLVALADGGGLGAEPKRSREYGQSAVTTRVASDVLHRNVAYERFTPQGPLALLPVGERLALIWATTPGHARQLCEMPEAGFLAELQHAFGGRLGRFRETGDRTRYPVVLRVAEPVLGPRKVALGNAAQTLHPVAGQGLNLGLRDAWELAETVREGGETLGSAAHLAAYASRRRLDRRGGIGFTDALVRLFSNDLAPLRLARGLGLVALGALPPLKDFVVRRMIFGARG